MKTIRLYIESDAARASQADEEEAANSVNASEYGNLTFPCSNAFSVNFKREGRYFSCISITSDLFSPQFNFQIYCWEAMNKKDQDTLEMAGGMTLLNLFLAFSENTIFITSRCLEKIYNTRTDFPFFFFYNSLGSRSINKQNV